MIINPNDPAFPTIEHRYDKVGCLQEITTSGLTIRSEIAARAMQGILSAREDRSYKGSYDAVAEAAVNIADALIAELNKTV